ncbi:hypothetical protein [Streptomyces sp. NBS 14/10]|uniref:hypothetical protein n=1 Tax=Streptomyces sp. NBS 14/10 TaxID=1945643 RepID=UPI0026D07421
MVHTSVGGHAARIRVSNRLGTAPLELGAATVALQEAGAPKSPNAIAGTLRAATFHGRTSATVPVGQDAVSDPVPLRVPADANLLITLYTPADSGPATYHSSAIQTSFLVPDGVSLPRTSSMQVMRHVGIHGGCRRGDRVFVCRGRRFGPDR